MRSRYRQCTILTCAMLDQCGVCVRDRSMAAECHHQRIRKGAGSARHSDECAPWAALCVGKARSVRQAPECERVDASPPLPSEISPPRSIQLTSVTSAGPRGCRCTATDTPTMHREYSCVEFHRHASRFPCDGLRARSSCECGHSDLDIEAGLHQRRLHAGSHRRVPLG